MRFTKKPVTIDAIQYTGDNFDEIVAEFGGEKLQDRHGPVSDREFPDSMFVRTLEGVMKADPGHWIIKGVKGELYPCKPDIFEATYSLAADADTSAESDGEMLARLGTNGERWATEFLRRIESIDESGRWQSRVTIEDFHDMVHRWFADAIEVGRSAGYSDALRTQGIAE